MLQDCKLFLATQTTFKDEKFTKLVMDEKEAKSEVDIQDAFDSLLLCEDSFVNKAYEEGLVHGEKAGFQEGFDLGQQKGSEIGSEIFFYRGFAKSWITSLSNDSFEFRKIFYELLEPCKSCLDPEKVKEIKQICQSPNVKQQEETDSKSVKALQKLLTLIESFPQENPKSEDIISLLQDIRAKFKHCCAVLKIEASYSAKNQLNF